MRVVFHTSTSSFNCIRHIWLRTPPLCRLFPPVPRPSLHATRRPPAIYSYWRAEPLSEFPSDAKRHDGKVFWLINISVNQLDTVKSDDWVDECLSRCRPLPGGHWRVATHQCEVNGWTESIIQPEIEGRTSNIDAESSGKWGKEYTYGMVDVGESQASLSILNRFWGVS